ncbi:MAG: hypothetical protein NC410_07560 [Oscillibacter sp.]|nr:hypothetical protein [Oscillibacter sp.]
MNTYRFKTTLKCGGCVAKLTPHLNEILAPEDWSADVSSPDKILTVTTTLPVETILSAVQAAGFKAELL